MTKDFKGVKLIRTQVGSTYVIFEVILKYLHHKLLLRIRLQTNRDKPRKLAVLFTNLYADS